MFLFLDEDQQPDINKHSQQIQTRANWQITQNVKSLRQMYFLLIPWELKKSMKVKFKLRYMIQEQNAYEVLKCWV